MKTLLLIQVCSVPTPVHCNAVFGKMQSPLLSADLQDRFKAGLYHCTYTYADLLFIQQNALPTGQCCCAKQAASRLVSLQINILRLVVQKAVQ